LYLFNVLSIPITPYFFNSQSLIPHIKNRIYHTTAFAHRVTKYYLPADKDRDGEMKLSCILTTEMLTDSITTLLLKPAFLK